MKKYFTILFVLAACAFAAHAHIHYGAGVNDLNGNGQADPGEPLKLLNFPSSGLTVHMLPVAAYGGQFTLGPAPRIQFPEEYFTFAALSDGQAFGAMEPGHAATGSTIWMEITSVTGPAGGAFGFWEGLVYIDGIEQAPRVNSHTTPTHSLSANEPTGGFKFILSEPIVEGAPDEDPYGHIHERAFSATLPGAYTVGFRLLDMSTNNAGGPIHAPSDIYTITFLAVPEPSTFALFGIAAAAGALAWMRRRRP